MATVHNHEQYVRLQKARIAKLRAGTRRGPITAAKLMAARLRQMSPYSNQSHPLYPHMYQTIKRSKNRVSLGGVSDKGFPYVHWVNATPGSGMERVNLFGRGKKVAYASTNHTGTPGFFWIAQKDAAKFFRATMIMAARDSLRSTI